MTWQNIPFTHIGVKTWEQCAGEGYANTNVPRCQVDYVDLKTLQSGKDATHKHMMSNFAVIDCEMNGNMGDLIIWGCTIYKVYGDKTPTKTGMKPKLDDDGNHIKIGNNWQFVKDETKWGWSYCEEHKDLKKKKKATAEKCPKCKRKKPKNYGKYVVQTKNRKLYRIQAWGYPHQTDFLWYLLLKHKIETVYSHWHSADFTALMTNEYGNNFMQHFCQAPEEGQAPYGNILFRGSGVLQAKLDIAPFYNRYERKRTGNKEYTFERDIYNRKTQTWEKTNRFDIEWRDSIALFNCALSKVGSMCDFPKGETPKKFTEGQYTDEQLFTMIDDDDVNYMIQDCDVVFQGINFLWSVLKNDLGYHSTELTLTAGTLGMQMLAHHHVNTLHPAELNKWNKDKKAYGQKPSRLFRRKQGHWKYEANWDDDSDAKEYDDWFRELDVFKGGRTQVFNPTEANQPMFGIDANQMYCSVQNDTDNKFPDPFNMKPCADLDTFTWLYGQGQIGAVHCHWKRPANHSIGVCATRTEEGSLDWNCEEATQWITTVEYQLMVDEGYEVEVIPCPIKDKVALLAPPLPYNPHQLTKKWYEARNAFKAEGNHAQYVLKVLTSSSAFGKFVEQNQSELLMTEADYYSMMDCDDYTFSPVGECDDESGQWGLVKSKIMRRSANTIVSMGSFITAFARKDLYLAAKAVGFDNVYYCDTDSLKHSNAQYGNFKDLRNLDAKTVASIPTKTYCGETVPILGVGLGQWKVEQQYDYWHSPKPKQYKYHATWDEDEEDCDKWELRIKGVSVNKTFEHETGLEADKNPKELKKWKQQKPITGTFAFPTVMSLRVGMRKQNTKQPKKPKQMVKKDGTPTQSALRWEKAFKEWKQRPKAGDWVITEKEV
ncbi:MAG: hypothetical protein ACYTEU_05780 [Planctomycetota bacterium]|jgi:hypothetical protein